MNEKKFNEDIIKSLVWYTGSGYKDFNRKLRNKISLSIVQKKHYENIKHAFDLKQRETEALTLYRGIRLSRPTDFKDFGRGYISTTTNIDEAKSFASDHTQCCVIKITVAPGSKIIDLSRISDFPGEDEILLSNDLGTFKITNTTKEMYGFYILDAVYIPNISVAITNVPKVKKVIQEIPEDVNFTRIVAAFQEDIDDEMVDDVSNKGLEDAIDEYADQRNINLTKTLKEKLKKQFKIMAKNQI